MRWERLARINRPPACVVASRCSPDGCDGVCVVGVFFVFLRSEALFQGQCAGGLALLSAEKRLGGGLVPRVSTVVLSGGFGFRGTKFREQV